MTPLFSAAFLCIFACAFFAGASALGKAVLTVIPGPSLHPFQVTAARFLFAFITLTPFLIMRGRGVFRTAIPLRHLQRVVLGLVGLTCIFGAVEVLPLADVMAVVWSSPLFALVFAAWFLRERVDGTCWVAAVVGFAGVVVIMRPSPSTFEPMVLLALVAAILTGAEVVTVRLLAVKDTGLTVLAINNAVGAVLACSVVVFFFMMPSGAQLLALAGVGVVTLAGQALFLQALRIAASSAVVPFCYSTLIWAALIGVLVFDKLPSWHFYLGASLIIAGGAFVSWRGERG